MRDRFIAAAGRASSVLCAAVLLVFAAANANITVPIDVREGSTVLTTDARLPTQQIAKPLLSNWTFESSPGNVFTWDLSFSTSAYILPSPGSQVTITNITLRNAKLDLASFLQLAAFNASMSDSSVVHLSGVTIVTDCYTLCVYQKKLLPTVADALQGLASGPGFVSFDDYTGPRVTAHKVNVTCTLPAIISAATAAAIYNISNASIALNGTASPNPASANALGGSNGRMLVAGNNLELVNALGYLEQYGTTQGIHQVLLTANMSLTPGPWPSGGLLLSASGDVTIWGATAHALLDVQGRNALLVLGPDVVLTLRSVTLANMDQARGMGLPGSIATLFAYPVWAVKFNRQRVQLLLVDVLVAVSKEEFQYLTLWTIFATSTLLSKAPEYHLLTRDVLALELETDPKKKDPNIIAFKQFAVAGFHAYDMGFFSPKGPNPFEGPVVTMSMPSFYDSLAFANVTAIAVYGYDHMLQALTQVTSNPRFQPYTTSLLLYGDVRINTRTWPTDGFMVNESITLYGMSPLNMPRYIDFDHVPRLFNLAHCGANDAVQPHNASLTFRNLELLNLANTSVAGYGVQGENPGTQDTLQLPFVGRRCQTEWVNISSVTMVIPYDEFKLLKADLAAGSANSSAYVSPIHKSLGVTEQDAWVHFAEAAGDGWSGTALNVTYFTRRNGTNITYHDNVFDPPFIINLPGVPLSPPADAFGPEPMAAWEISIIAAACTIAVVCSVFAITYFVRLRRGHTAAKAKGQMDEDTPHDATSETEDTWANVALGVPPATRRVTAYTATSSTSSGVRSASVASDATARAMHDALAARTLSAPAAGQAAVAGGEGHASALSAQASGLPPIPLVELNSMLHQLTREMDDEHLVILDVLGQGGYGTVYKALWKSLTVAVKTITFQDRLCGGDQAQHRAIMEAAISSSLAHPNVVTTYSYDIKPLGVQSRAGGKEAAVPGGAGRGGGRLVITQEHITDWKMYIIQEFCDGGSLRSALLDRRHFWDPYRTAPKMERIFETAIEVARGLSHLHGRNILHGDLSPSNILLKRDQGAKFDIIAKLCDFGLSVKMAADQSHISNMHRGTPFYTGPEVLQAGNYTKAADIFSLGVILWELYSGSVCYQVDPERGVCVYHDDFPTFPDRCPVAFADLTTRCIAYDPLLRPSIAEVLTCLEALQQQQLAGQQLVTLGQDRVLFGLCLESPNGQHGNTDRGYLSGVQSPLSSGQQYARPVPAVLSSGQQYARPAPAPLSSGQQYSSAAPPQPAFMEGRQYGGHGSPSAMSYSQQYACTAPFAMSSGQQYACTAGPPSPYASQQQRYAGASGWTLPPEYTSADPSPFHQRTAESQQQHRLSPAAYDALGRRDSCPSDSPSGMDDDAAQAAMGGRTLSTVSSSASSAAAAAVPAAVAHIARCTWLPAPLPRTDVPPSMAPLPLPPRLEALLMPRPEDRSAPLPFGQDAASPGPPRLDFASLSPLHQGCEVPAYVRHDTPPPLPVWSAVAPSPPAAAAHRDAPACAALPATLDDGVDFADGARSPHDWYSLRTTAAPSGWYGAPASHVSPKVDDDSDRVESALDGGEAPPPVVLSSASSAGAPQAAIAAAAGAALAALGMGGGLRGWR